MQFSQDVIQQLKQNNASAQEQVYRHCYSNFMKLCLRYTVDTDNANQILNDGFIKIFKQIHTYEPTGSFYGWMQTIMVRTAIDFYRKTKSLSTMYVEETILERRADVVDADAIHNMQFNELLKIVFGIPTAYRAVFNLFVFEKYSHKEIAELLNITERQSQDNLYKARELISLKINTKTILKHA